MSLFDIKFSVGCADQKTNTTRITRYKSIRCSDAMTVSIWLLKETKRYPKICNNCWLLKEDVIYRVIILYYVEFQAKEQNITFRSIKRYMIMSTLFHNSILIHKTICTYLTNIIYENIEKQWSQDRTLKNSRLYFIFDRPELSEQEKLL